MNIGVVSGSQGVAIIHCECLAKRLDTVQRQKSLPSSLLFIYGFFNVNQLAYFHHIQLQLALAVKSSSSAVVTKFHQSFILSSVISYILNKVVK